LRSATFLKAGLFAFSLIFTLISYTIPEYLYYLLGYYYDLFADILISPVLLFLVSYFIGKRIVLKCGLSLVIIPLLLGSLVGSTVSFCYFTLPIILQYSLDLIIIFSRFLYTISYCLQTFFISFAGMTIGVIRNAGK
jgi:hypothetical protein